jgi:hypothetical protein
MDYGVLQSESAIWLSSDLETPLARMEGLRAAVFDAAGTRVAGIVNDNTAQVFDAEIGTSHRRGLAISRSKLEVFRRR